MYADARRVRRCFSSIAAPIILAAALSLAGCSTQPGLNPTPAEPAAPSVSSAPRETGNPHDEEDDHPSVPVPEANASSQVDAVTAAAAAVTAFARPSFAEDQWWDELLPLLSQKGAVAYEGTLPSNIPVTAVTGTATVIDASTDVATLVQVPTDAGVYIVTLVRGSTKEPWLAERIRPAGQ